MPEAHHHSESSSASHPDAVLVAWTTVSDEAQAKDLARGAIKAHLAACAQVCGPITSFYRWEGKLEEAIEYRITFKLLAKQHDALMEWVHEHHDYDVPQWVVVKVEHISSAYHHFCRQN